MSDEFEKFKLEKKEDFKKPEKKVEQIAEKEIQALNDKIVNMLKTRPNGEHNAPMTWEKTKNSSAELFLKGW